MQARSRARACNALTYVACKHPRSWRCHDMVWFADWDLASPKLVRTP